VPNEVTRGGGPRGAALVAGPPGSEAWNHPDGPPELRPGDIHLWRADLDGNVRALPALERTLDSQELARASGFHRELERRRYVFAHGALRTILARYLAMPPKDLVFRAGRWGKPELAGGEMRFSLSRSHDLVLCAVSAVRHVGVDVEQVRPGVEDDLAAYLPDGARRRLDGLPGLARRRILLRAWTRLEAWVKSRGTGLEVGLARFDTFVRLGRARLGSRGRTARRHDGWVHDVVPRPGYVGAVATRRRKSHLRCWMWDTEEMCTQGTGIQLCRGDS
jgi:4'-phosphopantetheinyl transferase